MNEKQLELDRSEEIVLRAIFGDDYKNDSKFKLIETFKPGTIQTYINKFEAFLGPFLEENGQVNGYMLKSVMQTKYPNLINIIPDSNFRVSDLIKEVIKAIKGV